MEHVTGSSAGSDSAVAADIGFVGLGFMGSPMSQNLLSAGFRVTVWNRSTPAVTVLQEHGASVVSQVAQMRDLPVIIFMLPDLNYIEESTVPLLESWRENPPHQPTVLVVMSSVSPTRVREFGETVSAATGGMVTVVDAPVSGGTVGAQAATLAIMAGGSQQDYDRLLPIFNAMGKTVARMGELGTGSLAKACNQLLVGTAAAALAEAAELAESSGLDVQALFAVLGGGLAGSQVLNIVGPRIIAKDYAPTGPAKFMHKDLAFVLESAAQTGAAVPMAVAGHELYGTLNEQGLGDLDLAVVRESVARLSQEKN
ncbi:NAD(P)-dependent oxidoreductase [Jonesiaceae bacterium BS-20]|uniref:NAD(P)-dependent oxidoreductase n=1 Tax=Jonesiaceae bacterium BS-20 TaxID=3120821 RepID=A0AAU7DTB1_9MICO